MARYGVILSTNSGQFGGGGGGRGIGIVLLKIDFRILNAKNAQLIVQAH